MRASTVRSCVRRRSASRWRSAERSRFAWGRCGSIRGRCRFLVLTAKDSETDQVRGIGLGADDYISKDAGEPVLLARINRALARAATFGAPVAERKGHPIRLGKLHVDLNSLSAVGPGGEIIRLSKTEVDILKILDSDRGRFFTLDRIISELRGRGFACEDSLVYVNISRLRRKLGPVGELISCNRSAGYCLLK